MAEDESKKGYYDLGGAVDDYSAHEEAGDYLTDPGVETAAARKSEEESLRASGANLREAREAKGFSLEELSDKTGISMEALQQVELGQDFLPLGQLIRLSKALSVRMEDVISKGVQSFTIVRANERHGARRFGKSKEDSHGYQYEFLAPGKKNRKMEPFIVTLNPASSDQPSTHDGQEFIYVMEGQMELLIDDTHEILGPGDAVYYDSTSTHLVRAHGANPAKILAVLVE
jgi:transcriptional regulator with XRE-family HTH domain